MAFHDVDQDGLADLVILIPYEKVKVLRQAAGKDFEEWDVETPGGAVDQPWMSALDVDGDGLSRPDTFELGFLEVGEHPFFIRDQSEKGLAGLDVVAGFDGALGDGACLGGIDLGVRQAQFGLL